jgi:hypothetical protein
VGASVEPEWCCALGVFVDEVEKSCEVVSVPARPEKSGQLLRVYVYKSDVDIFVPPLRDQVEPFRIGGRDTVFENTPDGFVVGFRDSRQLGGLSCVGHG